MAAGVRYLVLLRGINVGGKNIVPMAELRAALSELSYEEVATYIQSGNVVLRAPRQPAAKLVEAIEKGLEARFGVAIKVVVLTEAQLCKVVDEAPKGFGSEDDRCEVIFLRPPLTAAKAFGLLECSEGIDRAWKGPNALYFARLAERASGSRLSSLVAKPEYKEMTIRNWRTTQKLAAMMDGA